MKRKSILLLIPFAAMALAGCGDDTPQCDSAVVTLDQSSITIKVGESTKIGSSISVEGCGITWSSDAEGIATVDQEGNVTGVAEGTAKISANGVTCEVHVVADGPVLASNINIQGTLYPTMEVGDTLEIKYTVEPENAANKEVTFESQNPDLASVSASGLITALAKGTAKVKVTSVGNPSISKTLEITINNKAAVTPTATSDGMQLVTEANLKDGDKIVINSVVEDKYVTMPEYVSGNYIAPVNSSIDADGKLVLNGKTALLTVEISDSALMFKDSKGRYLHALSGGNYLDFISEPDDACKFQLNVTPEGIARVVCTKEGLENNTLAYNSKNPRFSFYKADTAATYPKINLYKRDGAQPVVATDVVFDAEGYKVGVGLDEDVSAHVVPIGAEAEITYSLIDVEPAGSITLEGQKLHGVAVGTAKVVASINDGAISTQVNVVCEEIPPIIQEGLYTFSHTREGVKYFMGKHPEDATKHPVVITDADAAIKFEFVSTGKRDTFFMKTVEDAPVYLCASDTNDGLTFSDDVAKAAEWLVEEGSKGDKGDRTGAYDISTITGATKRFISMYNTQDFRVYNSATHSNRKENSDLEAFQVKTLESITVTPPTKLEYKQGEEINTAGMVVTANYTDHDPEAVEGYTITPTVLSEAGDIEITVSYKGKTDTFHVTVTQRNLVSIAVDGDMEKKSYETGDAYDPTGLRVLGTYDTTETEEISAALYDWSYDPATLTEGQDQVTVIATMKEGEITPASKAITGLTVTKKVIAVTGVYIDNGKYPNVEIDDEYQIQAHVLPEDADVQGVVYTVKSGSEGLLEVTEDGLVTAKAKGTGYVVVSAVGDPTKKEEVKFTINEKTVALPAETDDGLSKVTDIASLTNGRYVRFYSALEQTAYGMASNSGNYQLATAAAISSEKLATAGINKFVVEVNDDNTYSFKDVEGKYLSATATGNNLKLVASKDALCKFTVSVDEKGNASIVCAGSAEANTLVMNPNNGSPRFSCYKASSAATYKKAVLYVGDIVVESVSLSSASSSFVVGNTITVEAQVLPENAPDKSLTWTVENANPANCITVSEAGVVSASEAGTATIKATSVNGVYGVFDVTATSGAVSVTGVTLDKHGVELYPTQSETLVATVAPAEATDKTVAWSSDKPEIATVENGKVVAVAPGTASITVTTNDGSKTDVCTVTVKALEGGCHLANLIAENLPVGGMSEQSIEISGRIMFMPGNNLIIQDGDHAVIVYKSGQSSSAMQIGKKVSMTCKVQNYNGAAETESLKNDQVTVSDDVVSYNKVNVTSSALLESTPQSVIADYDNLILKAKPAFVSGSDKSVKVAFEDAPDKEYTLFMKKSLYSETVATVLNGMEIGGKFSITNSYGSVYNGAAQICCGTESVVTDKTVYAPESVVISNAGSAIETLDLVAGGASVTLSASVLPEKASQEVVWSTDNNDDVISVDNGVVTGLKEGEALVIATAKDTEVSKSVLVKVSNDAVAVESVSLNKTELNLYIGGEETLSATVSPENATDKTVSYVSDHPEIATVNSQTGTVTAVAAGKATITVVTTDGGKTDTCEVTVTEKKIDVSEVDTYSLTKDGLGLVGSYADSKAGADIAFTQLGWYSDSIQGNSSKSSEIHNTYAFSKPIKYIKINPAATKATSKLDICFGNSANPTGDKQTVGNPLTEDKAIIVKPTSDATFFSIVFSSGAVNIDPIEISFVEYQAPVVESVSLDKTTLNMEVGGTDVQLTPTIAPSDAEAKLITWSSDAESVATVANGLVHAVAKGTANITVTVDGKTANCVVTVSEASNTKTYLFVTSAKISAGDVTLGDVVWTADKDSGSYNSSNYKGIQIGTSSADGALKLTSKTEWGASGTFAEGYGKIKEVKIWMNCGGKNMGCTVTIGGKEATSDGTAVVKNSKATSYEDTTCVTYTPAAEGNTGVVVLDFASSGAAGYICAIQIISEPIA